MLYDFLDMPVTQKGCSHRDLNPGHSLERAVCLTGLHYRSTDQGSHRS